MSGEEASYPEPVVVGNPRIPDRATIRLEARGNKTFRYAYWKEKGELRKAYLGRGDPWDDEIATIAKELHLRPEEFYRIVLCEKFVASGLPTAIKWWRGPGTSHTEWLWKKVVQEAQIAFALGTIVAIADESAWLGWRLEPLPKGQTPKPMPHLQEIVVSEVEWALIAPS